MKASELRLGNFVLLSGEECQVQTVGQWMHTTTTIDEAPIEYVTPIPLTEEWLRKLGFIMDEPLMTLIIKRARAHALDIYEWQIIYDQYSNKFSLFINGLGSAGSLNIKFVHEIQNLYFALTGEELTIKETE